MGRSCVIFEDIRTFWPSLEPLPLAPDAPDEWRESYPYPRLKIGAESAETQLRVLVLANDLVRVVLAPALGGRILELTDLRSGTTIFSLPSGSEFVAGGPRGVVLEAGLRVVCEGLHDLAPVDVSVSEEDGYVSVAIGGSTPPVSWTATLTLFDDRPDLSVEVRAVNRTFHAQTWDRRPSVQGMGEGRDVDGGWVFGQEIGVAIACDGNALRDQPIEIAPFQTDRVNFLITPYAAMENVVAVSELGVLSLGKELRLQSSRGVGGARIQFQSSEGEKYQSVCDLEPSEPFVASLDAEMVAALVVLDEKGIALRYASSADPLSLEGARQALVKKAPSEYVPEREGRDKGTAAAAWVLHGMNLAALGRRREALHPLSEALNLAADHPLIWWMLATLKRVEGTAEGESPELLNAHFLAPFEPLLRAEAFLSAPSILHEPSALVKPLADDPDALVDIACWLADLELVEDLSRWVDEVHRHRPLPMLNYLLADALLRKSRMSVEAGHLVNSVANSPIQPPYPCRDTETAALRRLAASFPGDARLKEMCALCEWMGI